MCFAVIFHKFPSTYYFSNEPPRKCKCNSSSEEHLRNPKASIGLDHFLLRTSRFCHSISLHGPFKYFFKIQTIVWSTIHTYWLNSLITAYIFYGLLLFCLCALCIVHTSTSEAGFLLTVLGTRATPTCPLDSSSSYLSSGLKQFLPVL